MAINIKILVMFQFSYKAKNGYDFNRRIFPWEKEFGKNNIMVRLYDRGVVTDVCQEFLSLIGFAYKSKNTNIEINASLAPEFLNFVYMLDDVAVISDENRRLLIKELERLSRLKAIKDLERYPPALLTQEIIEHYKVPNKLFEEKHLTKDEAIMFLN